MSIDLDAALERVRYALVQHAERAAAGAAPAADAPAPATAPEVAAGSRATGEDSATGPLAALVELFGLSEFERDVLVLAAGIELDAAFAPLCAKAQAEPDRAFPTFGLALAAFDGDWRALLPQAPLRLWRLIELERNAGLTAAALRIDERILHLLLGLDSRDERLAAVVEEVAPAPRLVPSHARLAARIAGVWSAARGGPLPAIQLCGAAGSSKRAIAAAVCQRLGLGLMRLPAAALPTAGDELDELVRRFRRESMLAGAALLIDAHELGEEPGFHARVRRFVERGGGPLMISRDQRLRPFARASLVVEVDKPDSGERRRLWRAALDGDAETVAVDPLVMQFHLEADEIAGCVLAARGALAAGNGQGSEEGEADLGRAVWRACREQARPRLDDLARRVPPRATWRDLVLPAAQERQLREVAAQMHHRATVYDAWGFAATSGRGLGVSALFAGSSGTGKTLAAEVLAGDLDLDLYHIDLSSVISKYIGETEKNLRQVFDAAEEGGAVLLFDEADALFGKRSEVKDSHDRYANVEISYLLQRVESYRGLAILTSNFKEALDAAFLRRLRFVVELSFPDRTERAEMWRRVFPASTPTERLDIERLARLDLTGGNIRNIALAAAFLAAHADRPVRMEDLRVAVHRELRKLGKPLPEGETRDFSS